MEHCRLESSLYEQKTAVGKVTPSRERGTNAGPEVEQRSGAAKPIFWMNRRSSAKSGLCVHWILHSTPSPAQRIEQVDVHSKQ